MGHPDQQVCGHSAGRHQFLHVPDDELHAGHLSGPLPPAAQPARLPGVRLVFSPTGGRPHRAGVPALAPVRRDPDLRPGGGEGRMPVHPLGFCEEDAAGGQPGASGGPGLCRAGGSQQRRVGPGHIGIRLPNLLRFLGVLGHCGGERAAVRDPAFAELRLSVLRPDSVRVLAALAHLALHVVPRLCVHPAGGQPDNAGSNRLESPFHSLDQRALARGGVALRRLGRGPRALSGSQPFPFAVAHSCLERGAGSGACTHGTCEARAGTVERFGRSGRCRDSPVVGRAAADGADVWAGVCGVGAVPGTVLGRRVQHLREPPERPHHGGLLRGAGSVGGPTRGGCCWP